MTMTPRLTNGISKDIYHVPEKFDHRPSVSVMMGTLGRGADTCVHYPRVAEMIPRDPAQQWTVGALLPIGVRMHERVS